MALNEKDSNYIEQYELREQTRAAIAGYHEVLKIRKCLPQPQYKVFNTFDGMSEAAQAQAQRCNYQNALRLESYWNRGDWFPATGRTFETLFGMVWSKEPELDIQPKLEYLIDNADGAGCGLREVSQKITAKVIADARYGVFVDMPASPVNENGERVSLTRAQNESGEFLPKWIQYDADQIIYTRSSGGANAIDEVRLTEIHSKKKDDFDWEDELYIRRLVMIDNVFHNQLYNEKEELQYDITPISDGKVMSEIPFQFFGSDNNSAEYSKIPLYDLARGNLKHFVQDCDNADNLHYHGQGMTVVSTDMSKEEFNDMNPNGLDVGARGMNMLDAAGSVNVIQIDATGAIPAEMTRKEARMVMSGAQLTTDSGGNETATAKRIDANASMSSLKRMSYNIGDGLKQLFVWTAGLLGEESTSFYRPNTDFITDDLSPEMIKAHWEVVQAGGLPQVSFNETARKAQLTDKTDKEIAQALADQQLLTGGGPEEMAALQAQLDDALEKLAARASE